MSFNGKVILYQGVLATAPFYRCVGAACCISVKWPKSIKRLDIEVDSGAQLVQECWARARKWLSACLVCIFQLKVTFTFHFSSYLKPFWLHNRFCLHQDYGTECNINDSLCTATFPQSLYEEYSSLFFLTVLLYFLTAPFCVKWHLGYKASVTPAFDRNTVSVNPQCLDFWKIPVCWRKMPHCEQLHVSWFVSSPVLKNMVLFDAVLPPLQ